MSAQTRGLIGIILITIVILIYRKSRKNKIIMIILIAFIVVISSFRIENLFIRYNSPEAAFKNSGLRGNIVKTVDTANSTLVIYSDQEASSNVIFYKKGGKWVVPIFPGEVAMKRLRDGSLLILNKEKGKDNYYILISASPFKYTITDCKNSNFEKYELSSNFMFEADSEYVLYAEDIDENYYIEIDGQRFYVLQEVNF